MKHPQTPWAKMHTCHFSFEELDEGLGERKNPFIHDVIALLNSVLIVKEFSPLILSSKHKAHFQVIRVYNQTSISNYLSVTIILAFSLSYTLVSYQQTLNSRHRYVRPVENLSPTAASPQPLSAKDKGWWFGPVKADQKQDQTFPCVQGELQTQGWILEFTQLLHPGGTEAFQRNLLRLSGLETSPLIF